MPLQAQLRSETGEVLAAVGERAPAPLFPIPTLDDEAFPMLRGVDPYQDTYFSSPQMRWVVPELELLLDRAGDKDRQVVEAVLLLARQCAERPHRYLVFVGD